jgi:hypothetical protein
VVDVAEHGRDRLERAGLVGIAQGLEFAQGDALLLQLKPSRAVFLG